MEIRRWWIWGRNFKIPWLSYSTHPRRIAEGSGTSSNARQSGQYAECLKGGAVKKGGNLFAMAASVVAFISTAGMIALFLADDDAALQEAASVISKVKKLEANEEFYLV